MLGTIKGGGGRTCLRQVRFVYSGRSGCKVGRGSCVTRGGCSRLVSRSHYMLSSRHDARSKLATGFV